MAAEKRSDFLRLVVERLQVYLSPVLDVFEVKLRSESAEWHESFATEAEVKAFMKGVQAGSQMTGGPMLRMPEIPANPSRRFDEAKSQVEDNNIPF
jgi:hypothetical protein